MDTCEYPTRATQHAALKPCGQPATYRGVKPPKRFYCTFHNAYVTRMGGIRTAAVAPAVSGKGKQP